jgi:YD repeat-containing protein
MISQHVTRKIFSVLLAVSVFPIVPLPAQAYWNEDSRVDRRVANKPALVLAQATTSATITYDGAGRTATTLYTDQTCVAHKYNAQGNRTDTVVTKASTPETSVWASGVWGCSKWDHP